MALLASEATSYAQETAKRDAPIVRIFEFVVASDDLAAFMVAGRKNVQASYATNLEFSRCIVSPTRVTRRSSCCRGL